MAGDEEAEFRVVVVFGMDEDGEAVVAVGLDDAFGNHGGMDVFRDLDGVGLKCAVGVAGRRVVFPGTFADLVEEAEDFGGPGFILPGPAGLDGRDDDGCLGVRDDLEVFGGGFEIEGEGPGGGIVGDLEAVEDGVFVPVAASEVELAEVVSNGLRGERIVEVIGENFAGRADVVGEKTGGFAVGGCEEENPATSGAEVSVAVAAPGGLGEGIEAGDGAEDDGEVEIDAGFDDGGGDDAAGFAVLFPAADFRENRAPMGGAELGGKVDVGRGVRVEELEDLGGVGFGVEDAEDAVVFE